MANDGPFPEISRPLLSSDFIYFDLLPVGTCGTVLGVLALAGAPDEPLGAGRLLVRLASLSPTLLIVWLVAAVLAAYVLRPVSRGLFRLTCGDLGRVADWMSDNIPRYVNSETAFVIGPLGKAIDGHNVHWFVEDLAPLGQITDPRVEQLRTQWEGAARMASWLTVSAPLAWWMLHWHGERWSFMWVPMLGAAILSYVSAVRDARSYFKSLSFVAGAQSTP